MSILSQIVIYEYDRPNDVTATVYEYEFQDTESGCIPLDEREIEIHYKVDVCLHVLGCPRPINFTAHYFTDKEACMQLIDDLKQDKLYFTIKKNALVQKYSMEVHEK